MSNNKLMGRKLFLALAIGSLLVLAGCTKSKPAEPTYKTFATPEDAGNAVLEAAKSGDPAAAVAIFGDGSREVIYSGDAVQDKASADAYVQAYGEMHRWRKMTDGSQVLLVGADNFPFPIPLQKTADGKWYFDIAAGKDELFARRIGRNELAVIDICWALADGQEEYVSKTHDGNSKQFAAKFMSDPGKQNGLYWESPEGQPKSPLGPLVALATDEGYKAKPEARQAFHGY